MPDVRETYERNIEGLNDLYVKYENDIKKTLKELMDAEKYQEFSALLNEKLNTAILEFEKRNKSVKNILLTKLQLSFNVKDQGIVAEWEKAIINAKSKIEMLGNSLKELINKRITAQIGIPAIEKFLLDAAKRKAFTRITYDFVAKRLNVPANKVGEIAENLIFDGKLSAKIDVVSGTIIFSDEMQSALPSPDTTTPASPPSPQVVKKSPEKAPPQLIKPGTPSPEAPQLIDLSSEPSVVPGELLEKSSDELEIPPDLDFTEILDLASGTKPSIPPSPSPKKVQPPPIQDEKITDEEKEARNLISFFKSSVDELSEQEKEEARKIREEKKRKLEEEKKKRIEEERKEPTEIKEEEKPPEKMVTPPPLEKPKPIPFSPAAGVTKVKEVKPKEIQPKTTELKPPASSKPVSALITPSEKKAIPKVEIPPEKKVTCVICNKQVAKDDPKVIPCPHACGAYGHKDEFLKKGSCPKCEESISDVDIAFSELL